MNALLATSHPPNGYAVLGFGTAFLLISLAEILQNRRRIADWGSWGLRLFAVSVWLLMMYAGATFILEDWPRPD